MPPRAIPRRGSPQPKAAPGIAGAGGGTLLLLLAKLLPVHYEAWKQVAIYIAPSVSVGITVLLVWARSQIADYVNEKLKNRMFDIAQKRLEDMMANPRNNDEQRAKLATEIAKLQDLRVKAVLDVVYRKM